MQKFILNSELKIRKEQFGCIVLINQRRAVRFFNKFGYEIIKSLVTPKTIEEVFNEVNNNFDISKSSLAEIEDFINYLSKRDICRIEISEDVSEAIFYFDEIQEDMFSKDYFYTPLGVEIESTNKCGRQCTYCSYFSSPFVDINLELKASDWKRILDDIVQSGVFYVRFTGGDPFTRKNDLHQMVKYADDLGLMVSIGSDLTVTEEADFEQLSKLKNFVYLQTTLDGVTAESCEKYRGKGNFSKVMKGLELMQKHNVPFIVGTVLTKYNVNEIYKIGELISPFAPLGYSFAPLYIAGRGIGLTDDLPSNDDLYRANLQLRDLVNNKIIKPADSAWNEITNDIKEEEFETMLDDQSFLTRTGERLMRITPQGFCYVSVKLKRVDVENENEWNAGSILEKSLIEIWQRSDKMNSWRSNETQENFFGKTTDIRVLLSENI
jgi:MoaA/NifB/PqqE/SkfB family radical SAM enzyme